MRLWVLNGKRIKKALFIVVTAFFAALIAFVQNQETTVFSTAQGTRALSKVKTDQKQMALTFDINWGEVQVESILDILKEEGVKATLFVSGEWAERHKDIIEKMKKYGFEIESHGFKHKHYTDLESNDVRKDILLANEAIKKASGEPPDMIRPPYGSINKDVLKTASRLNQKVILWSVNPQDTENPGYRSIAAYVINHSKRGDIIRLHASDSAKQTVKALPLIIENLQNEGYSFVTMSTLISDTKVKTKILD